MNSICHFVITKLLLVVIAATLVGGCGEKTAPPSSIPEATKSTPEKILSEQFKK